MSSQATRQSGAAVALAREIATVEDEYRDALQAAARDLLGLRVLRLQRNEALCRARRLPRLRLAVAVGLVQELRGFAARLTMRSKASGD